MEFIVTTTEKIEQLLKLKKKLSTGEIVENLDSIGVHMVDSIRDNIKLGGRPEFTPLKPATLKRKKGETILLESGELYNGIMHEIDQSEPAVLIGPTRPSSKYAPTHNFGDEARGIPARTFLLAQPEDDEYINRFIAN